MRRIPVLFALSLFLLTPALSAQPSRAGTFQQAWSLSGWDFRQNLGRCTSGPGPD